MLGISSIEFASSPTEGLAYPGENMSRRSLKVVTGLAALAALVAACSSSSSSSTTVESASCSSASGTLTKITFSSCSPANAQYKTLAVVPSADALGGLLPWSPSGKTTKVAAVKITSTGTCPTGSRAFVVSTTVVAGGTATYTSTGTKAAFPLCEEASGAIIMQPGKKALI